MPRKLEKLPRWGYSYFLDTPTMQRPKKARAKDGIKLQKPLRLNYEDSIKDEFHTEVSCTVCRDAGCSQCLGEE